LLSLYPLSRHCTILRLREIAYKHNAFSWSKLSLLLPRGLVHDTLANSQFILGFYLTIHLDELESLLREKSVAVESPSASSVNAQSTPSNNSEQSPQTLDFSSDFGTLASLPASDSSQSIQNTLNGNDWSKSYLSQIRENGNVNTELHGFSESLDQLAGIASIMQSSPPIDNSATSGMYLPSPPATVDSGASASSHAPNENFSMVYMSWPLNLPDITMTRHLYASLTSISRILLIRSNHSVQAFFSHYIHARRMWHAPTFVASLDLHPDDARFPCNSTLHAMCAIGSLYASSAPRSAEDDYYQCTRFKNYEVSLLTRMIFR
jgi:hypothetical protein